MTLEIYARFQTMIDCIQMDDHDLAGRGKGKDFFRIRNRHGDGIADVKTGAAAIDDDNLRPVLGEGDFDIIAIDGVAGDVQYRFGFS